MCAVTSSPFATSLKYLSRFTPLFYQLYVSVNLLAFTNTGVFSLLAQRRTAHVKGHAWRKRSLAFNGNVALLPTTLCLQRRRRRPVSVWGWVQGRPDCRALKSTWTPRQNNGCRWTRWVSKDAASRYTWHLSSLVTWGYSDGFDRIVFAFITLSTNVGESTFFIKILWFYGDNKTKQNNSAVTDELSNLVRV